MNIRAGKIKFTKNPYTFLLPKEVRRELKRVAKKQGFVSFSPFFEQVVLETLNKTMDVKLAEKVLSYPQYEGVITGITFHPETRDLIDEKFEKELGYLEESKGVLTRDEKQLFNLSRLITCLSEIYLKDPVAFTPPPSTSLLDKIQEGSSGKIKGGPQRVGFMVRHKDWASLEDIGARELAGMPPRSGKQGTGPEGVRKLIFEYPVHPWELLDPKLLGKELKEPEFARTVLLSKEYLEIIAKVARGNNWSLSATLRTMIRSYFERS